MNSQFDWDDLKLILAIVRTGTLSGAGRALQISHATVFRRLGETERRLGVTLFERLRTGYVPTPAGEEAAAAARQVESEILALERKVVGRDLDPSGTVSVTTTDTLLHGLLSPIFTAFRTRHPQIDLDIAVSNDVFNLSRREADVAIRPASTPPQHLIGRPLGTICLAVYGDATLLGGKTSSWQNADHAWVGPDDRMSYIALEEWMSAQDLNGQCRMRANTMLGMYAAIRDGAGIGVLPCYLAENDPALLRLGETIPALDVDLWLLTHPALRRTARIRAFGDFTATEVRRRLP